MADGRNCNQRCNTFNKHWTTTEESPMKKLQSKRKKRRQRHPINQIQLELNWYSILIQPPPNKKKKTKQKEKKNINQIPTNQLRIKTRPSVFFLLLTRLLHFATSIRRGGGGRGREGEGGSKGGLIYIWLYKRKKYSPRRRQILHIFFHVCLLPFPFVSILQIFPSSFLSLIFSFIEWERGDGGGRRRVVLHKNIFQNRKIQRDGGRRAPHPPPSTLHPPPGKRERERKWMNDSMNGTFSGCSIKGGGEWVGFISRGGLLYITLWTTTPPGRRRTQREGGGKGKIVCKFHSQLSSLAHLWFQTCTCAPPCPLVSIFRITWPAQRRWPISPSIQINWIFFLLHFKESIQSKMNW